MSIEIPTSLTEVINGLSGTDTVSFARKMTDFDGTVSFTSDTFNLWRDRVKNGDPRINPEVARESGAIPLDADYLESLFQCLEDPGIELFFKGFLRKELSQSQANTEANIKLAESQANSPYYDQSMRILYLFAAVAAHTKEMRADVTSKIRLNSDRLPSANLSLIRKRIFSYLPEDTLQWKDSPPLSEDEWELYRSIVSRGGPLDSVRKVSVLSKSQIEALELEIEKDPSITLDDVLLSDNFPQVIQRISPVTQDRYRNVLIEQLQEIKKLTEKKKKECFAEALPSWYEQQGVRLSMMLQSYYDEGYIEEEDWVRYAKNATVEEHKFQYRFVAEEVSEDLSYDFILEKLRISLDTIPSDISIVNYGSLLRTMWIEALWQGNQIHYMGQQRNDVPSMSTESNQQFQRKLERSIKKKHEEMFHDTRNFKYAEHANMRKGVYREHAAFATMTELFPGYSVVLSSLDEDKYLAIDMKALDEQGHVKMKIQVMGMEKSKKDTAHVFPLRDETDRQVAYAHIDELRKMKYVGQGTELNFLGDVERLYRNRNVQTGEVPIVMLIPDDGYDYHTGIPNSDFLAKVYKELHHKHIIPET